MRGNEHLARGLLSPGPRLRAPWRLPLALSALVAAVAHIPVIGEHLDEATYMGVLFVLLTTACFGLVAAVAVYDAPIVYTLGGFICLAAVLGYAATRIVEFPMLADDVGNWLEPLGVVAVFSELVVIFCALAALSSVTRRPTRPRLR